MRPMTIMSSSARGAGRRLGHRSRRSGCCGRGGRGGGRRRRGRLGSRRGRCGGGGGGRSRRGGTRRRLGEPCGRGKEEHGEDGGERGATFHGRENYRSRADASSGGARGVNRRRDLLRLDAAVFVSGAALMALEIVGSRVLAPVFGTSLFVWGALITTFLAALAAGYASADASRTAGPSRRSCARPSHRGRARDRALRGARCRPRGRERRARPGPLSARSSRRSSCSARRASSWVP